MVARMSEKDEVYKPKRRVIGKTVKVQYEISPERLKEIESLMVKTGIQTKKELFNNALALLKWVIAEKENGRTLAAIDDAGDEKRILVMPAINI